MRSGFTKYTISIYLMTKHYMKLVIKKNEESY